MSSRGDAKQSFAEVRSQAELGNESSRGAVQLEIGREGMSLFFRQSRAERKIDFPLEGGAVIVVLVNGAGQFDEARAEVFGALARAEVFFDLPKRFVDLFKLRG